MAREKDEERPTDGGGLKGLNKARVSPDFMFESVDTFPRAFREISENFQRCFLFHRVEFLSEQFFGAISFSRVFLGDASQKTIIVPHLGEVAGSVGVDPLEERQLVSDQLEGQDADERGQPVVGGDHDRVPVQPLGKL